MAVRSTESEPDFTKSTGAFPMSATPVTVYVADPGVNYAKSTDAFRMHDDRNPRERVVEHVGATVSPTFMTPGPISHGSEKETTAQRKELGLSPDISGESDAGYKARPSTVTGKVVEPPKPADKPAGKTQATGK